MAGRRGRQRRRRVHLGQTRPSQAPLQGTHTYVLHTHNAHRRLHAAPPNAARPPACPSRTKPWRRPTPTRRTTGSAWDAAHASARRTRWPPTLALSNSSPTTSTGACCLVCRPRHHHDRPLYVCPDGRIYLETFSPVYKQVHAVCSVHVIHFALLHATCACCTSERTRPTTLFRRMTSSSPSRSPCAAPTVCTSMCSHHTACMQRSAWGWTPTPSLRCLIACPRCT